VVASWQQSTGPTLITIGGIHGNEPAGLVASRRVHAALRSNRPELTGGLVSLAGNVTALAAGERFIAHDLNRAWTADRIETVCSSASEMTVEDGEQLELLQALQSTVASADGPVYVLDLHTTSGHSPPFSIAHPGGESRALASVLPVPVVLGFERYLDGLIAPFAATLGTTAVALEAGQHHDPEAPALLEAAIWLILVAIGSMPPEAVPSLEEHHRRLAAAAHGLPQTLDVVHRHAIQPGDQFRMEPGLNSMQPVARGQLLARDRRGPIVASDDSWLLLPLYQPVGTDGFFLAGSLTGTLRLSPWS
jgi:succinylglutamate desuccinylase